MAPGLKEFDIANFFDRRTRNDERKHRLNREITAPEVRLNGPENEPIGIVSIQEALRLAGVELGEEAHLCVVGVEQADRDVVARAAHAQEGEELDDAPVRRGRGER